MFIKPDIELTADGSQTMRHPVYGQRYHSLNGAAAETAHVFIRGGFHQCAKESVSILEAGFGSGLNAYMTLAEAEAAGRDVHYTAVELYPVAPDTARRLDAARDERFMGLHESPWGSSQRITDHFTLHKIEEDLVQTVFGTTFDLVYYDAFAPDCQPELWSEEIFGKIFAAMNEEGILVTYSARGDVKRALRAAGFEVRRRPGAPGKRHMLKALKLRDHEK